MRGIALLNLSSYFPPPDSPSSDERSATDESEFKTSLISSYGDCDEDDVDKIETLRCMVLGVELPQDIVRATYIYARHLPLAPILADGLHPSDLSSPRNGLLLADEIAEAFEGLRLGFFYNLTNFVVVIFDPDLKLCSSIMRSVGRPFSSIENSPLKFSHPPFRRLLRAHFMSAVDNALEQSPPWLTVEEADQYREQYPLFNDGSDNAMDLLASLEADQSMIKALLQLCEAMMREFC